MRPPRNLRPSPSKLNTHRSCASRNSRHIPTVGNRQAELAPVLVDQSEVIQVFAAHDHYRLGHQCAPAAPAAGDRRLVRNSVTSSAEGASGRPVQLAPDRLALVQRHAVPLTTGSRTDASSLDPFPPHTPQLFLRDDEGKGRQNNEQRTSEKQSSTQQLLSSIAVAGRTAQDPPERTALRDRRIRGRSRSAPARLMRGR